MARRLDLACVLAQLDCQSDEEYDEIDISNTHDSDSADYAEVQPVIVFPDSPSFAPAQVLGEGSSNNNTTGQDVPGPDQMEDPPNADDFPINRDADDANQRNDSPVAESAAQDEPPEKEGRSRKRKRDPSKWKANVRKRLCQKGKPYLSVRKKLVAGKEIQNLKNCHTSCKFKCMENINQGDRLQIHKSYYQLDQNRKYDFIAQTTKYGKTDRPTGKGPTRRKKSIRYFFSVSGKNIRVCNPYYLGTLCISQKVIYNVHEKKDKTTETPKADRRGKHAKKVISEEVVQDVKNHILSFPTVESHYCRAKTEKRYLESNLNVTKMYDLYVEKCKADDKSPVKLSFYRNTFNSMAPALDFHKPKSDRCDKCEEYHTAKKNNILTDTLQESHQAHLTEKEAMRKQRQIDRNDHDKLVVSFDLQNVITCPKAEISSFFYRRKLNLYNLTGYDSLSETGYCAVWCETVSGRSANDIASALIQILERVVLNHEGMVKHITTWSDSCVPQSRNSVIAFAVSEFLSRHQNIETVTMKYCIPGHSAVQEIDNIHSVLEKAMSVAEFYSPVSAIRIMLKASRKRPYTVIQMRGNHFKDYQTCAKSLSYKEVPFSKVTSLKISSETPFEIQYKTSHQAENFEVKNLNPWRRGRHNRIIGFDNLQPKAQDGGHFHKIPQNKVADLKEMMKFMPLLDKEYYSVTFRI